MGHKPNVLIHNNCSRCGTTADHIGWCDSCAQEVLDEKSDAKEYERLRRIETLIDLLYEARVL